MRCGVVRTGSLMYSTCVISKPSGESADSVVLIIEECDFSSHQGLEHVRSQFFITGREEEKVRKQPHKIWYNFALLLIEDDMQSR